MLVNAAVQLIIGLYSLLNLAYLSGTYKTCGDSFCDRIHQVLGVLNHTVNLQQKNITLSNSWEFIKISTFIFTVGYINIVECHSVYVMHQQHSREWLTE